MNISKKETVLNQDISKYIQMYLPSIKSGNSHHFFIITDIYESSLTNQIYNFIENNYPMFMLQLTNIEDIDKLCIQILEEISPEKFKNIGLNSSKKEFRHIKDNLAFYLSDLTKNIEGLIIIIDDINQLTRTPEFANWYKSFADTLATSIENTPIGIIFIGTSKDFNRIYKHNPSVTRIFHTITC